ncbi:MAG: hypothetical protein ABSG01_09430 [Anaerolineales bacterium]|jgi:hypothetical protein
MNTTLLYVLVALAVIGIASNAIVYFFGNRRKLAPTILETYAVVFPTKKDQTLFLHLQDLSTRYPVSVSDIIILAVQEGLPELVRSLEQDRVIQKHLTPEKDETA